VFSEDELEGLPDAVARMLRAAMAPGTPLAQSAVLSMRGRIRLKRWIAFRATEVLAPHHGFVWAARAGPISGYDLYARGAGEMRWALFGLVPVMRMAGADVSRSAAGRAAGEAAWLPTALLPRFGVEWAAENARHLVARLRVDALDHELHFHLDEDARVLACRFERWGDPDGTGTHGMHPFGMEVTAHRTFSGMTIPSTGRAGWHHGTDRWEEGAFLRYEITDVRPTTASEETSGGPR
jgi:hypothetical protein